MTRALYDIEVSGCDDHTMVTVELTPAQMTFLTELAKRITAASTYGCEPTMHLSPHVHNEVCPKDHQ